MWSRLLNSVAISRERAPWVTFIRTCAFPKAENTGEVIKEAFSAALPPFVIALSFAAVYQRAQPRSGSSVRQTFIVGKILLKSTVSRPPVSPENSQPLTMGRS
ncbi:hypothetical protein BaRGS_00003212 [Batillaria attramentaria]|uniref:Uncharacterized protein n=1 Tax=Batillaria attramentaria TaxID=370345 RepID=A0ABD0M2N7_9CAEN